MKRIPHMIEQEVLYQYLYRYRTMRYIAREMNMSDWTVKQILLRHETPLRTATRCVECGRLTKSYLSRRCELHRKIRTAEMDRLLKRRQRRSKVEEL